MSADISSFVQQLKAGYLHLCGNRPPKRLLLAVSGGRDSMALLAGSHELQSQHLLEHLTVAHIDHGLRGNVGQHELEFVRGASANMNLPCLTRSLTAAEIPASAEGSIESAARTKRYEFLIEAAREAGCAAVVTAHHESDQAETVLHHLIRGSGLRGLSGIPESRTLSDGIRCLRPMLTIASRAVAEYVDDIGLEYCCDESNHDPQFLRNRLRHQLLPTLEQEYNQQVARHLTSLARQARELTVCLDEVAADIIADSVVEVSPDVIRIRCATLRHRSDPLLCHALTVLWKKSDWPRGRMTAEHWKRLAAMIIAGDATSMSLPGKIQATISDDLLRLIRNKNSAEHESREAECPTRTPPHQ